VQFSVLPTQLQFAVVTRGCVAATWTLARSIASALTLRFLNANRIGVAPAIWPAVRPGDVAGAIELVFPCTLSPIHRIIVR
jgi:hypothetical protein